MTDNARGMIAVDKMGGKVLFLNPATYATEVAIDGFPRTVHELLVMPETGLAYVPIFGDGIHGRNPNPGHLIAVIDLTKRTHLRDIDLRPELYTHYYKREFPARFHDLMDTRRWGPGKRIVFEPYTKESFDVSFRWIAAHGLFAPDAMGSGDYASSIFSVAAE